MEDCSFLPAVYNRRGFLVPVCFAAAIHCSFFFLLSVSVRPLNLAKAFRSLCFARNLWLIGPFVKLDRDESVNWSSRASRLVVMMTIAVV